MLTSRGGSRNLTTPKFELFVKQFGTLRQKELHLRCCRSLGITLTKMCFKNKKTS